MKRDYRKERGGGEQKGAGERIEKKVSSGVGDPGEYKKKRKKHAGSF